MTSFIGYLEGVELCDQMEDAGIALIIMDGELKVLLILTRTIFVRSISRSTSKSNLILFKQNVSSY